MTGLLLVLMFVLTIFMVVQFVLSETIDGQESKLDSLSSEVSALSKALGLERSRASDLKAQVGTLTGTVDAAREKAAQQTALIATLTAQRADLSGKLDAAQGRIASFEDQVAGLLAAQAKDRQAIAGLKDTRDELLSRQEALNLALATARDEIDAGAQAARLAAAKREALEAVLADLKTDKADLQEKLSAKEADRLVEARAAAALREKLKKSDAELTAMTLTLEAQRKKAEETLTMLAAAQSAGDNLEDELAAALLKADAAEKAQGETQASAEAARKALEDKLAAALLQLDAARTGQEKTQTQADADRATLEAKLAAALAQVKAARGAQEKMQAKAEAERKALESRLAALLATQQTTTTDRAELRRKLAAALAAKLAAEQDAQAQMTEAQTRAALLSAARDALDDQTEISTEAQRQQAVLNQQVAALRGQLGQLQALLDDYKARDAAAKVQIQSLGTDLNTALARAAAEERKRRMLEEAEAKRLKAEKAQLEAKNQDLEKYRSEFFGKLRAVLGNRDGVKIVGDRFVFSSEVLFAPGSADLSTGGKQQIARIADLLQQVAAEIPKSIDWVIQVDGHTDNQPLLPGGEFADNWELSQARALSVVRYMTSSLGIPPYRLSANGFGEFQPVAPGNSPEARAQNRRIELKMTER
ncbi:peptidoglycan -binding protein [Aquicoccus sp. G2-2]|uniref:peptidoglycan -binding protein n=1 Tax=Aquicoccus sp. G2-2 TaxID=3092120 RepID=UPI002AE04E36|nr:peptidoglycan -binding protein [Aquicoccus sp. G2-2]MEA1113681.1 peptidoglycan -binding protein [Aquicoccus sp. G2-2]